MTPRELATALLRDELPPGVELLKQNPVRTVARLGDWVVKVDRRRPSAISREVRALAKAAARSVPVPVLLDHGARWVATRFIEGRDAQRADHPTILRSIGEMHAAGMLHGDLHLGNVLMGADGPVLLDVQKSRFLPFIPQILRRRELGYFAFSLGDPLPDALQTVRFWRDVRAHTHWRSRTKRCRIESSGFTAYASGFRRREADPQRLDAALAALDSLQPNKTLDRSSLRRVDGWVVKSFASERAARRAWTNGAGLEARGIATGRALAWSGAHIVMEDAGDTLIDWIESEFTSTSETTRDEMARVLGELLARLHAAGIYHADLKANNVVWSPGCEPKLLDYDRVHFGWSVGRRRRVKNLAQLNAALPDPVPASLRDAAFRRYVERSHFRGDADGLRQQTIALSVRRAHRWSGC